MNMVIASQRRKLLIALEASALSNLTIQIRDAIMVSSI